MVLFAARATHLLLLSRGALFLELRRVDCILRYFIWKLAIWNLGVFCYGNTAMKGSQLSKIAHPTKSAHVCEILHTYQ